MICWLFVSLDLLCGVLCVSFLVGDWCLGLVEFVVLGFGVACYFGWVSYCDNCCAFVG